MFLHTGPIHQYVIPICDNPTRIVVIYLWNSSHLIVMSILRKDLTLYGCASLVNLKSNGLRMFTLPQFEQTSLKYSTHGMHFFCSVRGWFITFSVGMVNIVNNAKFVNHVLRYCRNNHHIPYSSQHTVRLVSNKLVCCTTFGTSLKRHALSTAEDKVVIRICLTILWWCAI